MKTIYNKIDISFFLYILILLAFLSGLFWNVIATIIIITIHELGHIIISKIFKWKIIKIHFGILGGYITYENNYNKPFIEELLVALGGILFQLIFYYICLILFKYNIIMDKTFYMIKAYHYTILLFNIMPIVPLDGAKVIFLLLSVFFPYKKSMILLVFISYLFLIPIVFFLHLKILTLLLIFFFLIKKIYLYLKNIPYVFNLFLFDRYINYILYKENNYIKSNNITLIKRFKNNYFSINNKYVTERYILRKRFD